MTLLQKIKFLGQLKKLSIRQIEIKAGLGNGVIRHWDKSSPSIATLQKVADALDINIKELI